MSVAVEAALIGAAVSLLTTALGEIFVRRRARQSMKESIRATYRKYAEPLAVSSTGLFWRLQEVFDTDGGGFYLKGTKHLTRYEHYKALSTLYRVANLLGWIQALRRELFFIPVSDPKKAEALDAVIQSFCASLAEGRHVEDQRVTALIGLWDLRTSSSPEARKRAGIRIDHQIKGFLHEKQVSSSHDLSGPDQRDLSQLVANALTSELGCPAVSDGVLGETVNRVVRALAVREVWVYRDWQAAIGDLMLRDVQQGHRHFEVIGYKEFEAACTMGEEADRVWLRRLYSVIDDLDVFGDQAVDARIDQLREAHRATAKIIHALTRSGLDQSCISGETRAAVAGLLRHG
jgi:hypothetical protein